MQRRLAQGDTGLFTFILKKDKEANRQKNDECRKGKESEDFSRAHV